MTDKAVKEKLRELAKQHLGWKPEEDLFDLGEPPFDISKPNIHDSKKDFLLERDTVREIISHLEAVFGLLYKSKDEETPEHRDLVARLNFAIETNAIQRRRSRGSQTAIDIALKNVVDAGFFITSQLVLVDMLSVYRQRLAELEEQETRYWSSPHRPPKYYPRIIALRVARFYARQTGTKPTYGTSPDGSHPSTQYSRLLSEVFSTLDIRVGIRGPATWAISQITDADLAPPSTGLIGGLMGLAPSPTTVLSAADPKSQIVEALKKGSDS